MSGLSGQTTARTSTEFEKDSTSPTPQPHNQTGTSAASVQSGEAKENLDLERVTTILGGQQSSPRTLKGWKWLLALCAIYSTTFLYGLDNTIVSDIQPAVVARFQGIEKLGWIGTGFPLGSVAIILPVGQAYGIFDIKYLYIISIFIFEVGSAVCGSAPTMDALIVGRVIAGAGGAGMYLGVLNLITVNTTLHERPLYMATLGVTWGLGTILGPVVGGAFADSSATWRWAFYINLVIGALFSPIYIFLLPSFKPEPGVSNLQKLKTMDWAGIVLNAGIYATWVMALTFGGGTWAWNDHRTIVMFVMFGVVLVAFIAQQYWTVFTSVAHRTFPVELLRQRSLILLFFGTSSCATALFIPIYYIPLYFQFVHGDSALTAAVRLLPFIIVAVTCTMISGGAMPKTGYYMPWYFLSGVFMTIGGALMYTTDSSSSRSVIYGYSILIAVGAGLASQAAYSIGPAKVKPHQVPAVIGFMNVAQIGGIVIALTISSTVYQNLAFKFLQSALAGMNFTAADIHGAIAGTQSAVFTNVSPAVRAAAIEAIVQAMNRVYLLVIAAGGLTLVSSVFLKREKLFMEITAGG